MHLLWIVALAVVSLCGEARAWGDDAHKIICEIAFRVAQPGTRAAIQKLIETDPAFKTFSDSCVFADNPRMRASEHFINLARDSQGLPSSSCPTTSRCLLTAISHDSKILASKAAKSSDRLIALKLLGHWVGDIHQPLHVAFDDDRGGANIGVSGQCSGNLHAAWDNCLVLHAVGPDVAGATTALVDAITPEMKKSWTASEPSDWANESFAIAKSVKTRYCVMRTVSCDLPSTDDVLVDAAYLDANEAVVKEQFQKAGVRLARLLDAALAD
ncbi:S1/P1 nuclease [Bradyrhizobium sp. th.b2]|uniref:S1/P1 nuclease n=1 Tax=Bradyrhizobium sp. th-b2 TaxID=172088 RepID=UPI0004911AA9|nr:S1/P1 nuclease [Bradyrhizobium sp. th.b2]